MVVLLALTAAVLSGSGDFLGGFASRRGRVMPVVLVNHIAGLVTVSALAPIIGGALDRATAGWGALAGISGAMAVIALYSGFSRSSMAVVSPIAAVGAGAWPVVWQVARGDLPETMVIVGLLLGLVAIWIISSGSRVTASDNVSTGVLLGLLAGLGFGGLLIFLSLGAADSGIWPLLPARATGSLVMLGIVARLRGPRLPERPSVLPAIAAGLLVTIGNGAFVLATAEGSLATVAVIASMFPAATIVLAWFVLGERLTRRRRLGLVLALIAVGLIAAG